MDAVRLWYVNIIRSVGFPEQECTGATADLKQRLKDHNTGKSPHTAKFAPWQLKCYVALPEKLRALDLERLSKVALRPGFCEEASGLKTSIGLL